jgi:uncharacterized protein (DUF2336 family)
MSAKSPMGSPLDQDHLEKVVLAQRIGQSLSGPKAGKERLVAEDIARVLARDVSVIVRQTLAFELRRADHLPHDLGMRIAKDIVEVSGTFLESTMTFSDEDLAALVPLIEENARVSIARRANLSGVVSIAIVEFSGERAVTFLLRNPGAEIPEKACRVVMERFEKSQAVLDQMASRVDLPVSVIEELVQMVSGKFAQILRQHYQVQPGTAAKITGAAHNVGVAQILESRDPARITAFVGKLKASGNLTLETVLQALEYGNKIYFSCLIVELTGIPRENVHRLINAGGEAALEGLFKSGSIPSAYKKRFIIAYKKQFKESD